MRRARRGRAAAGPSRLRSELLRTLTHLVRGVDRGLGRGELSADEIHDLHRELRRLASGLAVWAQLVPAPSAEAVDTAARRVRRLARLVGRARDRDVTFTLLGPMRGAANGALAPWHQFLGQLRDDTRTGRALLGAFLRTEREGGLFVRVRALLDLPARADAEHGLHSILAEERRRRQGRVRKAHRRARRDPNAERLHRLRIRIRQWRHLLTLESAAGSAVSPPPVSWRGLQERLGRLHDLDVALATIPTDLADSRPTRRLKERRRDLRRSVRASLDRIASRPGRAAAQVRPGGRR